MSNAAKSVQPVKRRHAEISERNRRVPSLRLHKASGQMFVVLSGKATYCGKPDDPVSPRKTASGPLGETNSPYRTAIREQSRQVVRAEA
jgi:hypothetical protein